MSGIEGLRARTNTGRKRPLPPSRRAKKAPVEEELEFEELDELLEELDSVDDSEGPTAATPAAASTPPADATAEAAGSASQRRTAAALGLPPLNLSTPIHPTRAGAAAPSSRCRSRSSTRRWSDLRSST